MLSAVLVELDGVLVDTRRARADAVRTAVEAAGLVAPGPPAPDVPDDPSSSIDDLVRATVARTRAVAAHHLDDTALALLALAAEREYPRRLATGVTLVDGAAAAITALGDTFRLAVVSAWRRADAERVLADAGLTNRIRFVAAADDGPGFATPAGRYRHAVARARRGTAAGDTVAALVGGAVGFAAARAAGARAVLVDTDVPLRDLTPARLIDTLDTASLVASPQP